VLWFECTGLCHYVYPGAMHSRFEHSLGAYHVAGQAVEILDRYQVSCMSVCCHCVQTGFALCCCLLQALGFLLLQLERKWVWITALYIIYISIPELFCIRVMNWKLIALIWELSSLQVWRAASLLSDLIVYSLGQTSGFNMASPPCPTLMFQFSSYFGSQNMHHASYVSSEAISIANTWFFMIGLLCALASWFKVSYFSRGLSPISTKHRAYYPLCHC